MRRLSILVARLDKALVMGLRFVGDVWYYKRRGHQLRQAIQMARDTIY